MSLCGGSRGTEEKVLLRFTFSFLRLSFSRFPRRIYFLLDFLGFSVFFFPRKFPSQYLLFLPYFFLLLFCLSCFSSYLSTFLCFVFFAVKFPALHILFSSFVYLLRFSFTIHFSVVHFFFPSFFFFFPGIFFSGFHDSNIF